MLTDTSTDVKFCLNCEDNATRKVITLQNFSALFCHRLPSELSIVLLVSGLILCMVLDERGFEEFSGE